MSLTPNDRQRRLAAKRNNERVKLVAATTNALAIGIAGSSFILPAVADASSILTWKAVVWIFGAMALHLIALAILGLLKSED